MICLRWEGTVLMHKFKAWPQDVRPSYSDVFTWCGRMVPPGKATRSLPEVECAACREAFARYCRSLPDVLRTIEEAEP